jgi:arginine/lysine/ornithine decarboxylase
MQSEMADGRYFVALVGLGDSEYETGRLVDAIYNLDTSRLAARTISAVGCPDIPPMRMSPRQANQQQRVRVPWSDAVGHVSMETICPYPPGIPVIVPGEEITAEVVEYLAWARQQGFTLRGDQGDGCIAVTK